MYSVQGPCHPIRRCSSLPAHTRLPQVSSAWDSKFETKFHIICRTVLGIRLLQGYGLTETSACGAIMAFDQNTVGDVGPPVQGVNIRLVLAVYLSFSMLLSYRLVDWDEGNYRVTDKPRPRGEVKRVLLKPLVTNFGNLKSSQMFRFTSGAGMLGRSITRCRRRPRRSSLTTRLAGGGSRLVTLGRLF